ncbi:MAG: ATP-binding protein [bacterium]
MQEQRTNYLLFPEINHWWTSGSVRPEFIEKIERTLFPELVKALNERQILLIEGPRRVGKTSLIYQLIHFLIKNQTPAKHIFYLTLDDPLLEKASLFEDIIEYTEKYLLGKPLSELRSPIYLFLDEITKFPDWELYLKRYYDLKYPLKFITSSSSAAFLQKKVKESLVGRVMTFPVTPFTFGEVLKLHSSPPEIIDVYADLRGIWLSTFASGDWNRLYKKLTEMNKEINLHQKKISTSLHNYLLQGGFPEYLQMKDERSRRQYFWENIAERVIFYDIPEIFKVNDLTLLQKLLLNAIENSGRQLNFHDLANSFQAPRQKISNYLHYLKASHLVYLLEKYAKTATSRMRAYKKIYTEDPGLFVNIQRLDVEKIESHGLWGILAELAVFLHLKNYSERSRLYYYRERNKEVDFVLESPQQLLPIEVKYRREINRKKGLSGVLTFRTQFKTKHALVVSRNLLHLDDNILFVPLYLFLS